MQNFIFSNIIQVTLGLSFTMCVGLLFQPLLKGLARALKLVFVPMKTKEERRAIVRAKSYAELTHMANSASLTAPSLSAELRQMACRM